MITNSSRASQSGLALIVGLIFLLIMSIAGLSSIQKVTLQERITGNTIDSNRAFQAAEIALAAAEENVSTATFTNAGFLVRDVYANGWSILSDSELLDPANWQCDDASLQNGTLASEKKLCTIQANFQDASVNNPPLIKYERSGEGEFTITVSVQGNGRSNVMLQSIYEYK
jgi:Tfp pilus assembly protein PilX